MKFSIFFMASVLLLVELGTARTVKHDFPKAYFCWPQHMEPCQFIVSRRTNKLSMVQGKGADIPYRLAEASEDGSALAMTDEDGGSRR
jgi:hypothetical protein